MSLINNNYLIKALGEAHSVIELIYKEFSKVVTGQRELFQRLMISLLTGGHLLIEGVPGLAKTLAAKTLSDIISSTFSRIQFTPDLLPADITGTLIFNQIKSEFSVKKGPIFANFVLADEINRAPAKVQSALLEAMQENQVTIVENTYKLPSPFIVIATQNPLEQEGTYPLSEAQTDRFMLKTIVSYPNREEELEIMRTQTSTKSKPVVNKIINSEIILNLKKYTQTVYIDEKIEGYILDIIFATRYPDRYNFSALKNLISIGASPRATISLVNAAKALALLNNRDYIIPTDIRNIAPDVLRHRVGLTFEAQADNIKIDEIISEILSKTEQP